MKSDNRMEPSMTPSTPLRELLIDCRLAVDSIPRESTPKADLLARIDAALSARQEEGAVSGFAFDALVVDACKAAYSACDMGPFPEQAVDAESDKRFVAAALRSVIATPTARGEAGDWYVSDEGSVCIDFDADRKRQLSLLCKRDGTVMFAAYIDGDRVTGNAMEPGFFDVLRRLAAVAPAGMVPDEVLGRIRRAAGYAGNFIGDERVVLLSVVERLLAPTPPAGQE